MTMLPSGMSIVIIWLVVVSNVQSLRKEQLQLARLLYYIERFISHQCGRRIRVTGGDFEMADSVLGKRHTSISMKG
jgi:hypothetical protein